MTRSKLLTGWVLAAVVMVGTGCGEPEKNLILVTMDTTRADRLGCYGHDAITPFINGLADRGTVFERAFTVAPITAPAHASILTGTYPPYHQVRDNGTAVLPDEIVTVAELFRSTGHQTAGIVAAYPVRGIFGFNQGFDYFSDNFDAAPGEVIVTNLPATGMARRPGGVVAREFEAWLEQHGGQPFFAWLHFFDPHMPYEAPAAFANLMPGRPYDAEIAYMDSCIGTVVKAVNRAGLERNTGWVLVGDHGEGLGDHEELTHALLAFNSTLHVPLVMWFPWLGKVTGRSSEAVSVVDVVPTVAQVYGLEPTAQRPSRHGRSLFPLLRGGNGDPELARRSLYFENLLPFYHFRWTPMKGVIEGRWKLLLDAEAKLYNLERDFAELEPVHNDEVIGRLREELLRAESSFASDRPRGQRAELDSDAIRQLQALGYVGAGSTGIEPEDFASEDLMNPDEGLPLWFLFDEAQRTARSGRLTQALGMFRELLEQQPVHKDARLLMAHVATILGDLELASATYDALLVGRPEIDVLHQAARYYAGPGDDLDRARECLQRLLTRWPRDSDALTQLARVELAAGKPQEAEAALQLALEVDPRARDAMILLARIIHTVRSDAARAEELLRLAAAAHPFDPVAHFNLAVLLGRTQRRAEAVQHLRRASSFAPNGVFAPAHLALARMHREDGHVEQARSFLEQLMLATTEAAVVDQVRAELALCEEAGE